MDLLKSRRFLAISLEHLTVMISCAKCTDKDVAQRDVTCYNNNVV
jgi:hypothetical protein